MQKKPPPLPANFFDSQKPPALPADFFDRPKTPQSAAGTLVGAIATAQKVIKPKTKAEARQYRKPIGPKPLDVQTFLFGTPKKTEIRSATKEEANRTPEQIEAVAAKMDAEIVRNLSDEDLGAAIEASYGGAYADLPRIPGNRLQIRETLLTERQRRLGEGIVPGVRQVAAFAANLPELTRGSLGSLGGNVQEASAGDTILAAGELAPLPFADDLLRFAGKVGGKLYKGVKEAIGRGDKAKLAQYAKNAEALGWKRPQTEPAPVKLPKTQPTPSGVSQKAKRAGASNNPQVQKAAESPLPSNDRQINAGGVTEPDQFAKTLAEKYGAQMRLRERNGDLVLDHIAVPKNNQKRGVGTAMMKELEKYADERGQRVVLTTGVRDPAFGTTSASRLKTFYKRFGFVENKGKDYSISENMLRPAKAKPTPPTPPKATPESPKGTKEAWEMRFTEARKGRGIQMGDNAEPMMAQFNKWDAEHKQAVESALKEGKPVPAEVLADYPDLAAKYGGKAEAPKTTPKPLESIGGPPREIPLSKPTGEIPNPKKVAKEPEVPKVEKPEPSGLSRATRAMQADELGTNKPVSIKGLTDAEAKAQGRQMLNEGWDAEGSLKKLAEEGRPATKKEYGALGEFRNDMVAEIKKLNGKMEKDGPNAVMPDGKKVSDARDELFERAAQFDRYLDEVKGASGQSLQSLKIGQTVNWSDLDEVKLEAQRWKPTKLTDKDEGVLQKTVDDLNEAIARRDQEIERLKETQATEGVARVFQDAARKRGKRTTQAVQADKAAARERIGELLKTFTPRDLSSGGIQHLFETAPDLAREIRRYIELSIEEFKLNKLDNQFYDTIRRELDSLDIRDPETGNKIDITDSDIRAAFAKHYETTSRTQSAAKAELENLRKQADLLEKIDLAKQGEVLPKGKGVPPASKEVQKLREELNVLLKALGASPADTARRTKLQNALAKSNEMLKQGYRNIKKSKPIDPDDVAALKKQIRTVRKEMALEDRIATLENQLESGQFKGPSKRVALTNARIAQMDEQVKSLQNRVKAAVRAKEPQGIVKKAEGFGRNMQLLNPFARIVDVASNTVKLTSYMAQNPVRSVLSMASKDAGREQFFSPIFTPKRFARIVSGTKDRAIQNVSDIWKGADLDTLEKFGRSGGAGTKAAGVTDVVPKDLYYRVALDDYAAGYARLSGIKNKKVLAEFRQKAWGQLTTGADGPLTAEQIKVAKTAAHDWALRQTFNVDNLASRLSEGAKVLPAQHLRKAGYNDAADAWTALVDVNARFTKVIANVALDKLNSYSGAGAIEAVMRTIAGKRRGAISSQEARLIADLAAKGLTGLAMVKVGEWSLPYLKDLAIEGEIVTTEGGTKFVRWTLLPQVFGGLDVQQLGGMMSPVLMGATKRMIDESGLTEKQKAALWARYQASELTSTPLAGNLNEAIDVMRGEKDAGKFAGSMLSRNVIPGGVREVAERMDETKTGVKLRKSDGFWDEFKKRTPVVRESLPPNQK